MDRHLPAIMSVIYAGVSPAKALADLEKAELQARKAKAKLGKRRLAAQARFQMN